MQATEILNNLFKSINGRDSLAMGELCDEEIVFHFPKTAPLEGRDKVLRFMNILFRKYPELIFTTGRIVVNGNLAATEWTNKGKDKADNPYNNAGVTFVELKNGKIIYMSDTFKDTEVF
ncbi:MAG: nuclear transport factor 2 family protein [Desulfobacterales bacterium]|nr:nuclear transport factor 2 family protein [Desulfobacterales bacterium]